MYYYNCPNLRRCFYIVGMCPVTVGKLLFHITSFLFFSLKNISPLSCWLSDQFQLFQWFPGERCSGSSSEKLFPGVKSRPVTGSSWLLRNITE